MSLRAIALIAAFSSLAAFTPAIAAQLPAAQLPAAQPATTKPAAQDARVRGRITAADTGAPLRQAQVRIFGADFSLRRAVTTDADGRYEFPELPPGRFLVSAARSGYVTLEFGQKRAFDPGTPVTLVAGQTATGINLALPRGSVIATRVVDEFGDPLPFVQVQALRYKYGIGGVRELAGTGIPFVTDDLGQARLFGLMPGDYVVSATPRPPIGNPTAPAASARPEDSYPVTYFPGTPNPADAQPVTIGLAQEAAVQIALRRARMGRVEGTVVNGAGRPAAGGVVTARSRGSVTGIVAGTGQIGADGRFVIFNVPPGDHVLDVRGAPPAAGARAEFASVPITVADTVAGANADPDANVVHVTITTTTGASISGRLTFEGAPPKAANEFRQFRVVARPTDPEAARPEPEAGADGRVAPDGSFAVSGLVGEMTFRVLTGPERTTKAVTFDGKDVMETPIRFAGAERLDGLRAVLTDRVSEVAGAVTDDRDQPLRSYVVVVLPLDAKPLGGGGRYTRAIRPNQDGRFAVRALPPGRYVVGAVELLDEGQEWDPQVQGRIRDYGQPITIEEGAALSVTLKLIAG